MGEIMALALQSLIGVIVIPLTAYAMAGRGCRLEPSQALRTVAAGLGLQVAIALVLLKSPVAHTIFAAIGGVLSALQHATQAGMQLVFGYLAGGPAPFDATQPTNGYLLAFRGLPLILVMSALTRLLYYWGVLPPIVAGIAYVFRRAFGIDGPLGTVAAAKIFVGMIEAPLLVRPYIEGMGRGALLATMSLGMATIAGTVMALYASILEPILPGAAGHVVAASLMNAPAALLLARLASPEGFSSGTLAAVRQSAAGEGPRSSMDAIVTGTIDGVRLLAAVTAMLVVATALVALANSALGALTAPFGAPLSIERVLGWAAAPIALAIGIPWAEAVTAGGLLAKKVVLNELVAYIDLSGLPPEAVSPRSRLILTYALCGFANLGSLGIMLGGLTAMVPARRADIVALGPRAVLVGLMATLLSGAVVGTIAGL
ncbi:MAG: nucleoside transporter C-terminal domain-containing protein [Hyphomicrobiaceae bacterium]|nr:nucleoside transporter C-terminal domain-containing protein [Hyphomicrobiaceae bacterium]